MKLGDRLIILSNIGNSDYNNSLRRLRARLERVKSDYVLDEVDKVVWGKMVWMQKIFY